MYRTEYRAFSRSFLAYLLACFLPSFFRHSIVEIVQMLHRFFSSSVVCFLVAIANFIWLHYLRTVNTCIYERESESMSVLKMFCRLKRMYLNSFHLDLNLSNNVTKRIKKMNAFLFILVVYLFFGKVTTRKAKKKILNKTTDCE